MVTLIPRLDANIVEIRLRMDLKFAMELKIALPTVQLARMDTQIAQQDVSIVATQLEMGQRYVMDQ